MSAITSTREHDLEATYRQMLRWYPGHWRTENADALVGTLLDVADSEGRNRPRRGEAVDLAVNGIGARVAAVLPFAARDRASSFAFATGLAWALVHFLVEDWMPWNPTAHTFALDPLGPFNSAGVIVTGLWVLAGLLVCAGRIELARIGLLVSAAVASVIVTMQTPTPLPTFSYPSPDRATFVLLIALAVIAAVGLPRRHWSTAAAGGGWALILLAGLFVIHRLDMTSVPMAPWRWWWYDFFSRYLWTNLLDPTLAAVVIALLLVAAAVIRFSGRRNAAVTLVLSIAPWTVATVANYAVIWTGVIPGQSIVLNVGVMATVWVALSFPTLVPEWNTHLKRSSRGTPDPA